MIFFSWNDLPLMPKNFNNRTFSGQTAKPRTNFWRRAIFGYTVQ